MRLTRDHEREIAELGRRYGEPRRLDVVIEGGFDPVQKTDRVGETCMVIRRRSGTLLVSIKTFYPRGAYRLPTGGIKVGETILDATLRESREETGLEVAPRRFLAAIVYRERPGAEPLFHTFAFLLDEIGGTLGTPDAHERIEEWREIQPDDLLTVAERLERVTHGYSTDIAGDWSAWGRFRAIVHRTVHDALVSSR